ncbi:response regulator [candidate division KSB1 bacterium]|nr:MAG: response regulator [candidate division KSB1 bacterium]MBC6952372.1 response regulator [candidate division KSB1 bacterium]MCE7945163.1 response regulator [Chlorobi bacterium CHB1]MDL1875394.1 response regulator [Cytophagia bacterium CHB2]
MKTILIVDDEKNLRLLYSQELKLGGYQVFTAANGDDALQFLREHRVDLVILDAKLEGQSGLEVLCAMMQQNRRLKVILNTAYSYYRFDFTCWWADAFLIKSSDLQELKAKVHELAPLRLAPKRFMPQLLPS